MADMVKFLSLSRRGRSPTTGDPSWASRDGRTRRAAAPSEGPERGAVLRAKRPRGAGRSPAGKTVWRDGFGPDGPPIGSSRRARDRPAATLPKADIARCVEGSPASRASRRGGTSRPISVAAAFDPAAKITRSVRPAAEPRARTGTAGSNATPAWCLQPAFAVLRRAFAFGAAALGAGAFALRPRPIALASVRRCAE